MADSFVRVPADDAGKRVDASSLDVGLATVYRQRIVIGDDSASAQFAVVTGGALTITGNINVSATAVVSFATPQVINNISATVQVAIGTPFTVNNISAVVAVTGNINVSATANVVIGAGAANIGSINNISATVVAVLGAGTANIGSINNVSATVVVAGVVALTTGAAVIGDINAISRTVAAAIATASFVTVRPLSGSLGNPSAGTALTVKTAFASITAASQTIVAAVVATRIRIIGYRLQAQGTTVAQFNAGSSGVQLSQKWSFQAREGTVVNAPDGCFEFESSAGEGITVAVTPTITVDASVVYVEIT